MLLAQPLHLSAATACNDLPTLPPRAIMDAQRATKLYGLLGMRMGASSGTIVRKRKVIFSSLPSGNWRYDVMCCCSCGGGCTLCFVCVCSKGFQQWQEKALHTCSLSSAAPHRLILSCPFLLYTFCSCFTEDGVLCLICSAPTYDARRYVWQGYDGRWRLKEERHQKLC